MEGPSVSQDHKQASLTTLTSTKRNLTQSNVNRQIQDFNIAAHLEEPQQQPQQRIQTQYQPIQNNNQSVVVVSSDQILHQNNTPAASQFSGIIPFDGSGAARVVNIVSNESMPMLLGNISQPNRAIAPTIAAPMQGKHAFCTMLSNLVVKIFAKCLVFDKCCCAVCIITHEYESPSLYIIFVDSYILLNAC